MGARLQEERVILVQMAAMRVVVGSRKIRTTLGSCVAVVLFDSTSRVAGLSHFMLPARLRQDSSIGKSADTALPALLSEVLRVGGRRVNIRAYVAGGANMFAGSADRCLSLIGEKNVHAARNILTDLNIPISYENVGGTAGRTVVFDSSNGVMDVTALGSALRSAGSR